MLPEIRALVAERQRFDDWLNGARESKRADTPARVFDRVHADYVARRNAVIEGLHAHVGSLEALEQRSEQPAIATRSSPSWPNVKMRACRR